MLQIVRASSVGQPHWSRKPVAIVGGGPSLRGFDFNRLRDKFTVLAVNASMFDIDFADAGFSLDRRAIREWWPRLRGLRFPQFYAIPDQRIHGVTSPPTQWMYFLRRRQGTEFTPDANMISAGGTSGFGALHLAYLKGARKIVLFGFDYGAGRNQVWHHNEDHYNFRQEQDNELWAQWARNFDHPAALLRQRGIEVINASEVSAITAFPKCSIDEALSP